MHSDACRILLVDDHDDTARALARLLGLSGYQVLTATSVAGAIELCEVHRFDLLISDIGLPDGTGYELMRELNRRTGEVKGIAVSGYEADASKGRDAGFVAHLVKPVAFDILKETIQRVLP
jgi:two-component system, chemotaxis family, CheB/CheR fusion protein